ncbi:hypothetical protein [Aeromicrobium yanjiei]|uniref:Uncharacterized protein n=1 Tax=Aeromicrobium yanjiei TaxID=2662028 RepID=A0A5Q2MGT1_9ACTN|nr:hypothetical protein [Aeromicrobium yanjiei]QGG41858.1 hypothetical protein GEV26_11045 [Aeromicrobium yanjiei]
MIRTLPDGRKEARCDDCDFVFTYGSPVEAPKPAATRTRAAPRTRTAAPVKPSVLPIVVARKQFPTAADAPLERVQQALMRKHEFLATVPYAVAPTVAAHWKKYQWVFSADGLDRAANYDLQQFVHDRTGGDPGSTTELDKAWTLMGELEGARRVRATIQHLLRGPGDVEDRFTELAEGTYAESMPGFGEALLTKTLAIAEPHRFLPILSLDEKRRIAEAVYGVEIPAAGVGSWTVGRLVVWTNDLLVELVGEDLEDLFHVAQFLRWAVEQ